MTQLIALIPSLRTDDEGQGLAEYALILSLIAIVAVIALIFMGSQVSTMLHTVGQVRLDTLRQTPRAAGRKARRLCRFSRRAPPRTRARRPSRTLQSSLRRARFPAVSS